MTSREIIAYLYAAWRIVKLDREAIGRFDPTPEGAWKSFTAAFLVAPVYLLLVLSDIFTAEQPLRLFLLQVIAYVISWVAFPLLMVSLTRLLGREAEFCRWLSTYNWFQIPQIMIMLPVALLALAAGPIAPLFLLSLMVMTAVLMYHWFIAHHALKLDGLAAAAVVTINFLLDLLIRGTMLGLASA
ncbi:hypothetical protein [Telmatospirillum sp. J64-1]|uniref:hypothetical protein n=1 Tax=Telmatospirillum sp. J64-1 TaxID=2502183 RepID=UPI00115DC524|nr:hypothetical protein [Telmatospirillum sp. J64-1]